MRFDELTAEQKTMLRENYLCSLGDISWGELADADELVTDDVLEQEFGHILFTEEDF